MSLTRRKFIRSFPIAAASGLLLPKKLIAETANSTTPIISKNNIHLERVTLSYPNLPEDLEGYSFSFMTDIHLGGWLKDEIVHEALTLSKLYDSKALLIGGDMIWVPDGHAGLSDSLLNKKYASGTDEELGERVFHELSAMIKAYEFQDGVYAVLGNHDRWSNFEAFKILAKESQTQLLLNQQVQINRGKSKIQIFGSEDLWTGIPESPNFSNDKKTFRILLTHNPDFASFVYHREHIAFDLSLSGHTHAGQIKLPLIGALAYNINDTRYAEGLVDYGPTKFYTSRGVGWVEIPMRINCPAEVTIFTLAKK